MLRMMFFLKWLARPENAPKDQLRLRKKLLSPRKVTPLKLRNPTRKVQATKRERRRGRTERTTMSRKQLRLRRILSSPRRTKTTLNLTKKVHLMKAQRSLAKVATKRTRRRRRTERTTMSRKNLTRRLLKSESRLQSDFATINELTQCHFASPTT